MKRTLSELCGPDAIAQVRQYNDLPERQTVSTTPDVEQFLQMCVRWKCHAPCLEAKFRTPIGEAVRRKETFPSMFLKLVAAGHDPIQLYEPGCRFSSITTFTVGDGRLVEVAMKYARKHGHTPIVRPECGARIMLAYASEFPRLFDVNETRLADLAVRYALDSTHSKQYRDSICRGCDGLLHPKFLHRLMIVDTGQYDIESVCKLTAQLAFRGVVSCSENLPPTIAPKIYRLYREKYVLYVSSILDSLFPKDMSHVIKGFVGIPSLRCETKIPGYVKI
jgi:hypothetical protein